MLNQMIDLQSTINATSRLIFATKVIEATELEEIETAGLDLVANLERNIDDEIAADVRSLKIKLESLDSLITPTDNNAYMTLASLISLSETIGDIKSEMVKIALRSPNKQTYRRAN